MIVIAPYKPSWVAEFATLGHQLRELLSERALAIHHIGSTSVPGLAAKDVIDVQVSVASLDEAIYDDLLHAGFTAVNAKTDHCPPGMTLPDEELAKMMVIRPELRAHIHFRVFGRFNQSYPLLCRDYLRTHQSAADAYGRIKQELARYFPNDIEAYYDIKDPIFDVIMAGARDWAEVTGWHQPGTDA